MVTLGVFMALGWWLDRRLGWSPWLLCAGAALGLTVGIYRLATAGARAQRREARKSSGPKEPRLRSAPVTFPLLAMSTAAAVVGALWVGFGTWWPDAGQDALVLAGVIGCVAAVVGHRARGTVQRVVRGPSAGVTGHFVGMGVRLLLTLAATVFVVLAGHAARLPFGVCNFGDLLGASGRGSLRRRALPAAESGRLGGHEAAQRTWRLDRSGGTPREGD